MKTSIEIHSEAQQYARAEKLYGDHTDLIKGFEAGYKAGYEAKEAEINKD